MKNDTFKQIKNSKYFILLGTEKYFRNVSALSQANYAKSIGKPFRIILQKGVKMPESFLEGVKDYKVVEVEDIKNIEDVAKKLCTE